MTAPRPYYGKPFMWLLFAVALTMLPVVGYMLQAGMTWTEAHPALNAMLNGGAAVFLVAGYVAIRGGNTAFHRSCMIAAVTASTVFLASYVMRMYLAGTTHYPGDGADRAVYMVILFSHMVLAAALVPMVMRTLYLAWRKRFDAHQKLARWTWPVWIYVSMTGVIVYLMLYPIAGALYAE